MELTGRNFLRAGSRAAAAALIATFTASPGQAQDGVLASASFEASAASVAGGGHTTAAEDELNALERGRTAVLIDLDENRLYFKRGNVTLWSAPIGTGTGMRVITDEHDWEFTTPTGRFQVQYKELNPVWIAPDWFFIENNLPVPAVNHSSRYMRGTLGDAAVYISQDLAIHGTNKPELIGQRVSHGCIRLENRFAKRLYNNVQVGTEVIIVGGEDVLEQARTVDLREGYDPSLASRGGRSQLPPDPVLERWRKMDNADLIDELESEFDKRALSRWDEIAVILLERSRDGDEEALEAVLSLSASLPTRAIELEWGTFLATLYRSKPIETLEGLAELDSRQRRQIAQKLVEGSVMLYGGEFDAPSAPWPTRRIHDGLLSRRAERGWEAVQAAERDHRAVIAGELAAAG